MYRKQWDRTRLCLLLLLFESADICVKLIVNAVC